MIESPLLQQLEAEITAKVTEEVTAKATAKSRQDDIVTILQARFGDLPSDLTDRIKLIRDPDRLRELIRLTAQCPDLAAFQADLS